MKSKEEVIKEAYGELGLPCNHEVLQNNGWLKIKPSQYSSVYDKVDLLKFSNITHSIRPTCSQGIKENNGWISIQSEKDLPRSDSHTLFEACINGKNQKFIVNGQDIKENWSTVKITHYKKYEPSLDPLHK
jgi:hypothetical protein